MLMLHLAACAFMTGVIWIIQILHYPAFQEVDFERFPRFHQDHSWRISFIVGPIMILELATGVLLLMRNFNDLIFLTTFVMLGINWICTFALSVPIHNSLSKKRDDGKIAHLIRTNWPRTILWSVRLIMLLGWSF